MGTLVGMSGVTFPRGMAKSIIVCCWSISSVVGVGGCGGVMDQ